jgi:hypothetical protein
LWWAWARQKPGGKYCLELVLNNPVATSNLGAVQYLTDRLRATPELGPLFTSWRYRHATHDAHDAHGTRHDTHEVDSRGPQHRAKAGGDALEQRGQG